MSRGRNRGLVKFEIENGQIFYAHTILTALSPFLFTSPQPPLLQSTSTTISPHTTPQPLTLYKPQPTSPSPTTTS